MEEPISSAWSQVSEQDELHRPDQMELAKMHPREISDGDLLAGLDAEDFAYTSGCDEGGMEAAGDIALDSNDVFMASDVADADGTGTLPSSQPSEEPIDSSQASQVMHPTPTITPVTKAPTPSGFLSATGLALAPVSESAKQKAAELFDADFATPRKSTLMTAGGSTLAPVSEAVKRKAEEFLAEVDTTTPKRLQMTTPGENALPPLSDAAKQQAEAMFSAASATSGTSSQGFMTASGKPLSPSNEYKSDTIADSEAPSLGIASSPSRQMQAGGSLTSPVPPQAAEKQGDEFDDVFADDDLFAVDAWDAFGAGNSLPEHIPAVVTFQSAGKKALKKPGAEALLKAHRIVEEVEKEIDKDVVPSLAVDVGEPALVSVEPKSLAESSTPATFTAPEPLTITTPLRSATQGSHRLGTPARGVSRGRTAFTTPRPVTLATPVPSRLATSGNNNSPIRLPLQVKTNLGRPTTPMASLKTPLKAQLAFQSPVRRVGLGVTPRAKRGGRGGASFTVPFLDGRGGPATPSQPSSLRSVPPVAPAPKYVPTPVFDLHPYGPRSDMKQSFFHPHHYDKAELVERGVPEEIFEIDIYNAEYYAFQVDGVNQTTETTYQLLHATGCTLLSPAWVTNHWRLILWKLAGQVRARPQVLKEKWSWHEVVNQLKYRYEREFNNAQRSSIKRIQERDSAASMPMHLCIAAIHRPVPEADSDQAEAPALPVLELTDGWYRIKSSTDAALGGAIKNGRLRVGHKLAINGARLDSTGEGRHVLEALDKSHLLLSGNSTSLARWHVKLGQQPKPFVSTIRSLTPTGGVVALMDVRVTRVFPLAFVDSAKGSTTGPWSADEELQLQDQWERNYNEESTRLHAELSTRLEKLEDLVQNLIASASDTSHGINAEPPPDLEDRFEALLEARNSHAALRQCSAIEVAHLAQYGRSFLESERASGADDVQQELKSLCSPRNVRNFRIIRFDDAQDYCRRTKTRTAQLNVWDAQTLGDDAIMEGRRYLISNLIPGQLSSWTPANATSSSGEIYLHTRRDTRWQLVE